MRRLLLLFFLIVFLIISPAVIMYTAGYRYDWQNGLLKKIGAISIDVTPKNATVYINGQKIKDTMPIRLNNITPNKYSLRLAAPGYYDWLKEITVKNKQTIYIKEINLLKKTRPELIVPGHLDELSLSADGNFLIYAAIKDQMKEIILRDMRREKNFLLFPVPKTHELKTIWAANNNFAAVMNGNAPYINLTIVNADNPETFWNINAEIKTPIEKMEWRKTSDPEFCYSTKLNIISAKPLTRQQSVVAKNTFMDWYMDDGQLWTIESSTSTNQLKITKDTLGFGSVFALLDNTNEGARSELNPWTILAVNDDVVLLKKDEKESEMMLVTPDQKFNVSGEKFTISKYNNWWLIWTPWELWTYSKGEKPFLLSRSGEQLREVIPLDEYNTLGLVWAKRVTALFPYYFVTHELVDTQIISVVADSVKRVIYFTGLIEGVEGLWILKY